MGLRPTLRTNGGMRRSAVAAGMTKIRDMGEAGLADGPERPRDAAAVFADRGAEAQVSDPELLGAGFRPYERFTVELGQAAGGKLRVVRDLLRIGRMVGVIAVDLQRDEIMVLRQFRLAAQLGTRRGGRLESARARGRGVRNQADAADSGAYRRCVRRPTMRHDP